MRYISHHKFILSLNYSKNVSVWDVIYEYKAYLHSFYILVVNCSCQVK